MKYLIYFLFCCFSVSLVTAQQTGTVHYKETIQLKFNIQGGMPNMPDMPKEHVQKTTLAFDEKASLYKNDTVNADQMNIDRESEDGDHFMFRMPMPDNQFYCDLADKKTTEQRDFMQRKFLIENDLSATGWKLTGKQKMVLNYPCQQAVKQDSTDTTEVWFTPVIPLSTGPGKFVGLPGLVLEVNVNNGDRVITAESIDKTVADDAIEKPKDGKKVTQEEFDNIVAEKMKEMGIENGPGGNVIIKIEDH